MLDIKSILIRRDGLTPSDASALITEAKQALWEYLGRGDIASAEEVCSEYFGLEPDYLTELI